LQDIFLYFIANLRCSTQWCHNVTTMLYKFLLHGYIARMYSCTYGAFTAEAENNPLCDQQHGIHGIRQANPRFTGCIIRIIELNTHCATSDVNPFKIRCNLQITKETVNETQWWHFINDVSNDVNISHWCHSETSGQKNLHMMID